jgi:hypothetical protein
MPVGDPITPNRPATTQTIAMQIIGGNAGSNIPIETAADGYDYMQQQEEEQQAPAPVMPQRVPGVNYERLSTTPVSATPTSPTGYIHKNNDPKAPGYYYDYSWMGQDLLNTGIPVTILSASPDGNASSSFKTTVINNQAVAVNQQGNGYVATQSGWKPLDPQDVPTSLIPQAQAVIDIARLPNRYVPQASSNIASALSNILTNNGQTQLTAAQAEAIAGANVGYRGSYGGYSGTAAQNLPGAITAANNIISQPVIAPVKETPLVNTGTLRLLFPDVPITVEQKSKIEQGIAASKLTATDRDDLFWSNENEKYNENLIGLSAQYHSLALKSDKVEPLNPFEMLGDAALRYQQSSRNLTGKNFTQLPSSDDYNNLLKNNPGSFLYQPADVMPNVPVQNLDNYFTNVAKEGPGQSSTISSPVSASVGGNNGSWLDNLNSQIGGMLGIRVDAFNADTAEKIGGSAPVQELPKFDEYYKNKLDTYTADLAAWEQSDKTNETQYNYLLSEKKNVDNLSIAADALGMSRWEIANLKAADEANQQVKKQDTGIFAVFNDFISSRMPVLKENNDNSIYPTASSGSKPYYLLTPLIGEERATSLGETVTGPVQFLQSVIPTTPRWTRESYANIKENPAFGIPAAAFSIALTGVGAGARTIGVGTKVLGPTAMGGKVYQAASKGASALLAGLFANYAAEETTGTSLIGMGENAAGKIGTVAQGKEPETTTFEDVQKKFPGWDVAAHNANRLELEAGIAVGAFKVGQKAGDIITGYQSTRSLPSIEKLATDKSTPLKQSDLIIPSEEGFPTNPTLKTRDLVASFKEGKMTTIPESNLVKTKMSGTNRPLTAEELTGNSQGIAAPGTTDIYSGAEYPHLKAGFIDSGHSEIPGMSTSPKGLSYFTKAGTGIGNTFGITNDLLGIYRRPTMYVTGVKKGKYTQVPEDVLHTPTGGKSINDPTNPRNIAIGKWIRENNVPYDQPIIGQHGKSEFEFHLRAGGGVTTEPIAYYKDAGIRIPVERVTLTGEASPKYIETAGEVGTTLKVGETSTKSNQDIVDNIFGGVKTASKSYSPTKVAYSAVSIPTTPSNLKTSPPNFKTSPSSIKSKSGLKIAGPSILSKTQLHTPNTPSLNKIYTSPSPSQYQITTSKSPSSPSVTEPSPSVTTPRRYTPPDYTPPTSPASPSYKPSSPVSSPPSSFYISYITGITTPGSPRTPTTPPYTGRYSGGVPFVAPPGTGGGAGRGKGHGQIIVANPLRDITIASGATKYRFEKAFGGFGGSIKSSVGATPVQRGNLNPVSRITTPNIKAYKPKRQQNSNMGVNIAGLFSSSKKKGKKGRVF